ncbi:hypothetical protein SD70_09810 [Gordoniibacillus kamchatkensis]|uniref:SHSP domain-containing protein n=1 Tax=Gordoniibacillus kamchatkensis TaxID=1590651 RepID=A0ABR5AJ64_9BACL|nr:Hsp20/alpha crystallin family protein [Paenibacillus sp. VKM B-2647]KIL41081.1 hypothetical protein SD70_09810 [Paenibacillus sp. VKM B-2647]
MRWRKSFTAKFWTGVFDQDFTKQFMNEFSDMGQTDVQALYPRVDIIRGNSEFIVLIDIPGVRKEDVQLSVTSDFLYVKGTARHYYQELQIIQSERFSGSFERAIRLPEQASPGKISAKFESGLLEVRIGRQTRPQTVVQID